MSTAYDVLHILMGTEEFNSFMGEIRAEISAIVIDPSQARGLEFRLNPALYCELIYSGREIGFLIAWYLFAAWHNCLLHAATRNVVARHEAKEEVMNWMET